MSKAAAVDDARMNLKQPTLFGATVGRPMPPEVEVAFCRVIPVPAAKVTSMPEVVVALTTHNSALSPTLGTKWLRVEDAGKVYARSPAVGDTTTVSIPTKSLALKVVAVVGTVVAYELP